MKIPLVAVIGFVTSVVAQNEVPNQLILSVTLRDFLPIQCMNVAGTEAFDEVLDAWEVKNLNLLDNKDMCSTLLADSEWRTAIEEGTISGHPDFNAIPILDEQALCNDPDESDGGSGINFPVGSCIFQDIADETFSIVSRDLALGPNGLPRLQYCSDESGNTTRCGFTTATNGIGQTQTQKQWFDLWYTDNLKYNRRVGARISLTLDEDDPESGKFFFSGAGADTLEFPSQDNGDFFGPLDVFKGNGANEVSLAEDPLDVPAWPQSSNDAKLFGDGGFGLGFWFTSEVHTTFEFREDLDMTFKFSGDDDFWAFVNGKMVVDVGGVHTKRTREIDLRATVGNFSVQNFLGLENGQVYTLDIFHAERQVVESNFELETTLFAACNVVQSGSSAFSFADIDFDFDSDFVASRVINEGNSLVLMTPQDTFSASSVFRRADENLLRGFTVNFDARVGGNTNGFAFVVQGFGVDDLPKTTGKSFNLAGLTNALAVVFDLCVDGGECRDQQIRLHYPSSPEQTMTLDSSTLRVHDNILRNLKRNESFPVEIVYFGGKPDFLEVSVNNSLYLRQNNFDIGAIIGGGGGHVGFTASTSEVASDIVIDNFKLNIVKVDPKLTQYVQSSFNETQEVVADGGQASSGISIVTFDFCGNQLDSGSLGNQITAFYLEQRNDETGRFFNDSSKAAVVPAVVTDNGDGTYTLSLQTKIIADFSLVTAFGIGCEIKVNQFLPVATLDAENAEGECFFSNFNNGDPIVKSVEPEVVPTAAPEILKAPEGNEEKVAIILSSTGAIILLGCIFAILFVRYKRKWERDRDYVPEGNLYRLELNAVTQGDEEYHQTGAKLLATQQEILALQAQADLPTRDEEIALLKLKNDELKNIIKETKESLADAKAKEDAGEIEDDDEEEDPVPKKKRAKTSFNDDMT